MRIIYLIFVALLAVISGCAKQTPGIEPVRTANVQQDPFKEELRSGYVDLSDSEWKQGDKQDARFYGQKALRIVKANEYVPPVDDLTKRNLSVVKLNKLAGERNFLVSAMAQGIHRTHPTLAAQTQLAFDCWVEQEEEGHQKPNIQDCQHRYLLGKQNIVEILNEKTRQDHEEKLRHEAEQKRLKARGEFELAAHIAAERLRMFRMPAPYVVFFDYNKTNLDLHGQKTIEKVADEVNTFYPRKIIISGHTDLSGSKEYNMQLGHKRAQAIATALTRYGVDPSLLDIRAYGENSPNVYTPDGKKEAQNRYGKIYFLKDNRVYY